jgi:hypothetical protein
MFEHAVHLSSLAEVCPQYIRGRHALPQSATFIFYIACDGSLKWSSTISI